MCLDNVWSEEKTKKWLSKRPDTITAYKVVRRNWSETEITPPFFTSYWKYEKENKIENINESILSNNCKKYVPYFHLCLTKRAAKKWQNGGWRRTTLKCKIPKKAITAIGEQWGCITIITKEFTFVEGDEYFKKEEE